MIFHQGFLLLNKHNTVLVPSAPTAHTILLVLFLTVSLDEKVDRTFAAHTYTVGSVALCHRPEPSVIQEERSFYVTGIWDLCILLIVVKHWKLTMQTTWCDLGRALCSIFFCYHTLYLSASSPLLFELYQ